MASLPISSGAPEREKQVIPVILMVERGFSEEKIVDWIEGSLQDCYSYPEFHRMATVYTRMFEEIYAHICVGAEEVCHSALLQQLSSPPKPVMGLKVGWT